MGDTVTIFIILSLLYVVSVLLIYLYFRKKNNNSKEEIIEREITHSDNIQIQNVTPTIINIVMEEEQDIKDHISEIADFSLNFKSILNKETKNSNQENTTKKTVNLNTQFINILFNHLKKIKV